MRKLLLFVLILLSIILPISCSKSNTDSNPFQGNWSGNVNGDIVGTWSGTISSTGNFNGIVITTQSSPNHDFVLSGQVNENGVLVAAMKNTTFGMNIDFVGTLQSNLCNGSWFFDGSGMFGTWNGTKE